MSDNNALFRAFYELAHSKDWSEWEYRKAAVIPGFGTVRVVSSMEDCRRAYRDSSYHGEFAQGSTAPAGLVFEVTYIDGDVRLFQKDGTYDSYGSVSYDGGGFYELKAVEKTVVAYERVDGGRKA